jgi:putative tricarboxylic transport membrane protein
MADRLLAIFVLVLSGIYLIATYRLPTLAIGDPLGPKVFPYIIGVAGLLAAIWLFVDSHVQSRAAAGQQAKEAQAQHHPLAVLAVLAWLLIFYTFFERLGFVLSCAIFLLGLTAFFYRGHWIVNLSVSLGFPLFVYFGFTQILGISLPRGVLPI